MQRTVGNRAVVRMLQKAEAGAAEKTPLELGKDLLAENPSTAKERAAWLLKAAEQNFLTFNTPKAKQNLVDIKDAKKVENLDPAAAGYDVPILDVEVGLVKKIAQRWVDANGVGEKKSIQYGSMIRSSATDKHGTGRAIDINALAMTTSVDATVQVLDDLDKSTHASYGVGLPFQGDFFDPADDLQTKKAAAEKSASADAQSISVADAVTKTSTHTYKATATKTPEGTWKWGAEIKQEVGGAYKRLKSKTLKDKIEARRKDGIALMIFPDNDNHMHLDMR